MKKFEIINNSLVVTDTVTSEVLFDAPKRDTYYDVGSLQNAIPSVQLIDTSSINNTAGTYSCLLSQAVNSSDVAFTESTFIDFARANLGFKTTTGGSVVYDNSVTGLTATTVQGAIDEAYADAQLVKSYQGGYDANTNTPNLTTPTAGVVNSGYVYDVTVAGTFFGEVLEVGDSLRAKVDDPSSLADWVAIQNNLTAASIKVQYESNADTNAFTDADVVSLGNKLDSVVTGEPTGFAKIDNIGTISQTDYDTAVSNSTLVAGTVYII